MPSGSSTTSILSSLLHLKGAGVALSALAFSRDGKLLAAGSAGDLIEGSFTLWDLASGSPRLRDHRVTKLVAWSDDGRRLASDEHFPETLGLPPQILIRDPTNGRIRTRIRLPLPTVDPEGPVPWRDLAGIAWSADGRRLVVRVSEDGPEFRFGPDGRRAPPLKGRRPAWDRPAANEAWRPDGRFRARVAPPGVELFRRADGASLWLRRFQSAQGPEYLVHDGAGLVTGDPGALARVRYRLDRDVRRGRLLTPGELPSRAPRPMLLADFLAGQR